MLVLEVVSDQLPTMGMGVLIWWLVKTVSTFMSLPRKVRLLRRHQDLLNI
jgi:hypothetical protein